MNKKLILALSLLAVAILVAALVLGCSQAKGDKNAKAQDSKVAASGMCTRDKSTDNTMNMLMTASALYACPMHPEFISADPNAKCSICGMKTEMMPDEKVAALRAAHAGKMGQAAQASSGCQMGDSCAMPMGSSAGAGKCPMMSGSSADSSKHDVKVSSR